MQEITTRRRTTIRALGRAIGWTLLLAVAFTFAIDVWVGALAILLWLRLARIVKLAVLSPFFGVEAVRTALFGHMVLEPKGDDAPRLERSGHLVGSVGVAATDLKYEGYVVVDEQRYPARSDRLIEAGAAVEVVDARLGLLLVVPQVATERGLNGGPDRSAASGP